MLSSGKNKIKVFHGLVNYGTQAGFFSQSLRDHGVDSLSVAYHDAFKRQVDIELDNGKNLFDKILKRSWNILRRIYWFFRYNTFHFYYGTTLFRNQVDLPFYRVFRKKIIMEYLGYDVQLYQYSLDKYDITNVRYYKEHSISLIADKKKINRLIFESKFVNQQIVCAPYLSEFVPNSLVLPLAIDLKSYSYTPKEIPNNQIIIMHAPTSRDNKGSSFILDAINRLKINGYNIKYLLIENITHDDLKRKYIECDIFIDQILAGWYGTTSIEAMALGRPTICFIRESYYKYIDYGPLIPIINANTSTIYSIIKKTIDEKHLLPEIGKKSRDFVEKIHNVDILTSKLINIYSNC